MKRALLLAVSGFVFQTPGWSAAVEGSVAITLTPAPGQAARAMDAQKKIQEILRPPVSREPQSSGGFRFQAAAWSTQISEQLRRESVAALKAEWREAIKIEETGAAFSPEAARGAPAVRVPALAENMLTSAQQDFLYDGTRQVAAQAAGPVSIAFADSAGPYAGLSKPLCSGIDLGAIDRGVSPCADFYGSWQNFMKHAPIPTGETRPSMANMPG